MLPGGPHRAVIGSISATGNRIHESNSSPLRANTGRSSASRRGQCSPHRGGEAIPSSPPSHLLSSRQRRGHFGRRSIGLRLGGPFRFPRYSRRLRGGFRRDLRSRLLDPKEMVPGPFRRVLGQGLFRRLPRRIALFHRGRNLRRAHPGPLGLAPSQDPGEGRRFSTSFQAVEAFLSVEIGKWYSHHPPLLQRPPCSHPHGLSPCGARLDLPARRRAGSGAAGRIDPEDRGPRRSPL